MTDRTQELECVIADLTREAKELRAELELARSQRNSSNREIERLRDRLDAMTKQASSVPDGWQLVPKVPTPMMQAAFDCAPFDEDIDTEFCLAYRAMLAAAPQPKRSECSWQETSARRPEREQTIVVQRANGRLFIGVYDEHFCQPRCVDRWTGEFVSGFDLWFAVPDCAERSAGDEREGRDG